MLSLDVLDVMLNPSVAVVDVCFCVSFFKLTTVLLSTDGFLILFIIIIAAGKQRASYLKGI